VLDKVPVFFEKKGTKAIRPRARVIVHGEEGISNLLKGERMDEGGSLGRGKRGRLDKGGKVEVITGRKGGPKKVFKEPMEDVS
jgi:hypothetical protein